jgi:hypothetical protein
MGAGEGFSVRLLLGLGKDGLAELREQLAKSLGVDDSPGAELTCTFVSIGREAGHKSDKNPVQRAPFSRAKQWIEIAPGFPMCERCTSTLRKHYTGNEPTQTTAYARPTSASLHGFRRSCRNPGATCSLELAAAFVNCVTRYKCRNCDTWHSDMSAARQVREAPTARPSSLSPR